MTEDEEEEHQQPRTNVWYTSPDPDDPYDYRGLDEMINSVVRVLDCALKTVFEPGEKIGAFKTPSHTEGSRKSWNRVVAANGLNLEDPERNGELSNLIQDTIEDMITFANVYTARSERDERKDEGGGVQNRPPAAPIKGGKSKSKTKKQRGGYNWRSRGMKTKTRKTKTKTN